MGKLGGFLLFVCVIVGFLLLNLGFGNAIHIPDSILSTINMPLNIVGGILVIAGGFFMLKLGKGKEQKK